MNKTYCFTDIHGNYNLWKQISEYCDETDKIYFLGDAIDRGPHGLKIMSELLKDPRVIYLKGNHEDFFAEIGSEIIRGRMLNASLWEQNGGTHTIEDLLKLSGKSQLHLIEKVDALDYLVYYKNKKGQTIILSHAGVTPGRIYTKHDLLWDRLHFIDKWPEDEVYKNYYVVHGHTPVQYFKETEVRYYCDGHKIDLDLCTALTDRVALFDLDTLTVEKVFTFKEEINES